jgi:hypothetical protein
MNSARYALKSSTAISSHPPGGVLEKSKMPNAGALLKPLPLDAASPPSYCFGSDSFMNTAGLCEVAQAGCSENIITSVSSGER